MLVSQSPLPAFFDAKKPVEMECDASKNGLGAVLIQGDRPVHFASRTMTTTETRYAQIEKELLAIRYAVSRFHYFIYPKQVTVYTDHRPLINIVAKPLDDVPLRLQRMLLAIQRYNVKLLFRPGREMKYADALSRCPMAEKHDEPEDVRVIRLLPLRDKTVIFIRDPAKKSESYEKLLACIRDGWPETKKKLEPATAEFYPYRARLTVEDDLILHGDAIAVPRELRGEFVRRSCYAHMSVDKTFQRARSCIFWPHMKKDIELHVQRCQGCQLYPNQPRKEPMIPHEIPARPWQKVGLDIAYSGDTKLLIAVCYYSNLLFVISSPAS